jgi:hypothetical protein
LLVVGARQRSRGLQRQTKQAHHRQQNKSERWSIWEKALEGHRFTFNGRVLRMVGIQAGVGTPDSCVP